MFDGIFRLAKHGGWRAASCLLERRGELERCQLAADVAVCGSLLWMVAVLDVPNCLNGSRAMVQWNGSRGALLSRGSAFAIGACQVATILARSELERPRDAYFEAVCACPSLTFGSGSSLMVSEVGLSHGMRSGSLMCLMLARFGLNPPCEPAHMLLTVCFRFTSWTGQSTVIPRAISIVFVSLFTTST